MSYSRWSNSRWYTFWRVPDPETVENRDNALFEVCGVTRFNAKDLREHMITCLDEVRIADKGRPATQEEMDELRSYMLDFLSDIEQRYPENQQFAAEHSVSKEK